ncbi:MAG: beta-ketoacyl-[acyl-carrier-protein] synthase family protein [Flavobacteriales bacterium]
MSPRVHISGIGIISALGNDAPSNLDALVAERTGIGPITRLNTRHRELYPAAEVKLEHEALCALAAPASMRGWSRTALLGLKAVKEAVAHAGIDPALPRTGLLSASTAGGMDRAEPIYRRFFDDEVPDEVVQYVGTHDPGEHTARIAEELGISGFITTISTACSSSANAIMLGARMIRSGKLDVVIAGGSDALSRFTVHGFHSLMILDRKPCTPFDAGRAGLNLGEAAAYVVLESEAHLNARRGRSLACVTGYANTNDAFHVTASSPDGDGAYMAMSQALRSAGLEAGDIGYINVHGTGTNNNDGSEGRALMRLFGDALPPFSSTKTFTGHTLGAAGAVEAVYATLAVQHGLCYANLRFQNAMPEAPLVPVQRTLRDQRLRHVLSNSFGFGGNNTSLIISAP